MFENDFKLLKIKNKKLYIFDKRGGGRGGGVHKLLSRIEPSFGSQVILSQVMLGQASKGQVRLQTLGGVRTVQHNQTVGGVCMGLFLEIFRQFDANEFREVSGICILTCGDFSYSGVCHPAHYIGSTRSTNGYLVT